MMQLNDCLRAMQRIRRHQGQMMRQASHFVEENSIRRLLNTLAHYYGQQQNGRLTQGPG